MKNKLRKFWLTNINCYKYFCPFCKNKANGNVLNPFSLQFFYINLARKNKSLKNFLKSILTKN
ncbi:hypothetical protein Mgra_00004313 [Meloidogyne graminicola]|uniref:Uncharacterized protein n=1 Tax=Meloidogyne graminicola TaxID=189291 RepID=A0A8S9ZS77_9BILA|nr:hypothetical protein Mgra_00004313 [Meloidogyne graminicola]